MDAKWTPVTDCLKQSTAVTDRSLEKKTEIRLPDGHPATADRQICDWGPDLCHFGMHWVVIGILDRENAQATAQTFQSDDLVQDKGL
jgi:hypothetical protein